MNCKIQNRYKLINDYLTGEISAGDRQSFEEHLFVCDECFAEMVLQEETASLVKTKGRVLFADYLKKRDARASRFNLLETIKIYPGRLKWEYVVSFATIFVVAILIGTYFTVINFSDNVYRISYDEKIPHEYDIISLRGESSGYEGGQRYGSFLNRFKIGISDYNILDYENAINNFESIVSIANELSQLEKNEKYLPWIRDLYFYNGLSYLALSVSKKIDADQIKRKKYSQEALKYLTKAESLVSKYQLKEGDREKYFIGEAFGLSGDKTRAVEKLKEINSSDRFYNKSMELITNLTDEE